MHAGDFLLGTNILLSGNNYAKISLLFKFMNLGMVDSTTFYTLQDSYCVDTIKDFWTEKRSEIISQLQSQGPVVVLGKLYASTHTQCYYLIHMFVCCDLHVLKAEAS